MTALALTSSVLKTSVKFWGTSFKFCLCPRRLQTNVVVRRTSKWGYHRSLFNFGINFYLMISDLCHTEKWSYFLLRHIEKTWNLVSFGILDYFLQKWHSPWIICTPSYLTFLFSNKIFLKFYKKDFSQNKLIKALVFLTKAVFWNITTFTRKQTATFVMKMFYYFQWNIIFQTKRAFFCLLSSSGSLISCKNFYFLRIIFHR